MNKQSEPNFPDIQLGSLDELWFQVAGTVCNLTCEHCFISCSPQNHSFDFLTFAQVESALLESVERGVREYYFTGGEPFLNKELVRMLQRTLDFGPATVLTNGTVLKANGCSNWPRPKTSRNTALNSESPLTDQPLKSTIPSAAKEHSTERFKVFHF